MKIPKRSESPAGGTISPAKSIPGALRADEAAPAVPERFEAI